VKARKLEKFVLQCTTAYAARLLDESMRHSFKDDTRLTVVKRGHVSEEDWVTIVWRNRAPLAFTGFDPYEPCIIS